MTEDLDRDRAALIAAFDAWLRASEVFDQDTSDRPARAFRDAGTALAEALKQYLGTYNTVRSTHHGDQQNQ